MRNTTKKILSMLLAVIMLLSVMPVAYAAPKEYPPDAEQMIELCYKLFAYSYSIYEPAGYLEDLPVENPFSDLGELLDDVCYRYEDTKQYFPEFIEIFQPFIDKVEQDIANGDVTVVFTPYNFFNFYYYFQVRYGGHLEDHLTIKEGYRPPEIYVTMFNDAVASVEHAEDYLEDLLEGKITVTQNTQAEFDAIWKETLPICNIVLNCIEGIHLYGEYISNGDATEEADGTKTATCEFCGATDTVVDEGSKIDNNDNSKCSCNCHKSGIMGLIWKIIRFFYKIFGMNKTCICGVAHY